ncbi:unnamed protein product [Cuscuta epithymum]|uniref:AP2/ERF domain-containing protein n=1 Tax=Cuscuta epithymum TaxID=186058 RepID=A0AAV0EPX5_9ASTE|nr:unnamed protein product [Cuscuta epithymum]
MDEDTEEKAAAAYDIAAIQQRGPNALTNFDISNYADKLREIREAQSNAQPIEGGESSRAREAQQLPDAEGDRRHPLLHNNRPAEFTELQPTQVLREADCVYSSALNAIVSDEDEFLKFWMKAAVDPYPVPYEYEAVDETAEGESYSLDCFDALMLLRNF